MSSSPSSTVYILSIDAFLFLNPISWPVIELNLRVMPKLCVTLNGFGYFDLVSSMSFRIMIKTNLLSHTSVCKKSAQLYCFGCGKKNDEN
jgi:hypothetical protein